ncbi:MAG: hypothetical protein FJ388_15470 [Verrucomicrobia bacterium]|nr:hypothetical protein [Verrucomicrobiota bacterium]
MQTIFRGLLWALTALWISTAYAQVTGGPPVAEQEVVAEGRAAGADLKARDEAINRALRAAIEKGVGTLVDSETMTQNFQLLDDRVYSQVKGYVRSYDVTSDNNGEGGIYRIKVKAIVALGALRKDIQALNIIKTQKKNPRMMVMGVSRIEAAQMDSAVRIEDVRTALEGKFSDLNFPLVSKDAAQVANEKELQDVARCAALGRKFDAEVVVTFEAIASLQEASEAYGIKVFAMNANINAKAINTDNAQIICVDRANATSRGPGMLPTAQKALSETGVKLAESMAGKIIEKWRSEVFNTVDVKIVVNNINYAGRNAVIDWLKQQRGVASVNERLFANNAMELDLSVEGSVWGEFDRLLDKCPAPKLTITTRTPNRIDCQVR